MSSIRETFTRLLYRITPIWKTGPWRKNDIRIGGGILRRGWVLLQFGKDATDNKVVIGDDCVLSNVRVRFTGKNSKLLIGNKVKWKGYILIHGNNRSVTIGDETTCRKVYIMCRDADIRIGEKCMLSRGIEIRSSDVHRIIDIASKERVNQPADVSIGRRVWVGANATLSKGAHISRGSVVGAESFVNKHFKNPNVVVAGVPARVVKTGIRWKR